MYEISVFFHTVANDTQNFVIFILIGKRIFFLFGENKIGENKNMLLY